MTEIIDLSMQADDRLFETNHQNTQLQDPIKFGIMLFSNQNPANL